MTYTCDCGYSTEDKSNYNKHIKNPSHNIEKEENIEETKFLCKCGKKFEHQSSYSRHKKNCTGLDVQGKLKEMTNEMKKIKEMTNEMNKLKKEVSDLKKIIDEKDKAATNNIVNSTVNSNNRNVYNLSVKSTVQKKYANASHFINDMNYAKLKYNGYELIDTLIYRFEDKTLCKYIGDYVINHYKKKNPSEQSMWSSDTSRLTYLINELLENKKSVWNHDYKGVKVKELILMPLLNYIRNYVNEQLDKMPTAKPKTDELNKAEAIMRRGMQIASIKSELEHDLFVDDLLKYITPYFAIDRADLQLE